MRRRRVRVKQLLTFAFTDLVGVLLGLGLAYALRFHAGIVEVTKSYSPQLYLDLMPLAALTWVFWLEMVGCYGFRERAFNLQILKKLVKASALAMMTIIVVHFFQRTQEYSRPLYPLALLTCTFMLSVARLVLDRILARMRRKGRLRSASVAILGTGNLGQTIAEKIRNHAYLGMKVAGFVTAGDTSGSPRQVSVAGFRILGGFDQIREVIREHGIDEIIIAQPDLTPREVLNFMLECEKEIVTVRLVPNLLEAMLVEMSVEQIDGIPLFALKESPLQGWNIVMKRIFDVVFSLLLLIALSPVIAAVALLVKLTSPGPVLYKQKRVGLDGRRFTIRKFRSMYIDAEERTGPVWASRHDPRVTPVGRWLRRLNLDELPQLWNVLRGNMSLVGPRPERPHFVKKFREAIPRYMVRHRVKAGITGWAQVNGLRGNTSIDERIKYDIYYIDNWSIWLDLKILLLTVTAHENAY